MFTRTLSVAALRGAGQIVGVPWFRFIEEAKITLAFRNGQCAIDLAVLQGEEPWAWVAQKVGGSPDQVVLVRMGNMMALQIALMKDGFAVESGSPAEKVMRAAVRCGYAEELPDEERWRREIILARAAAATRRDSVTTRGRKTR